MPDLAITELKAHGTQSQWSLIAKITNNGLGALKDNKSKSMAVKIEQKIKKIDTNDRIKEFNKWYVLKSFGGFGAGESKWTTDMALPGFELVIGVPYEYSIKVNPAKDFKETNYENNVYSTKLVLNADGSLRLWK